MYQLFDKLAIKKTPHHFYFCFSHGRKPRSNFRRPSSLGLAATPVASKTESKSNYQAKPATRTHIVAPLKVFQIWLCYLMQRSSKIAFILTLYALLTFSFTILLWRIILSQKVHLKRHQKLNKTTATTAQDVQ